ncbi:MAG TPA: hypothetical protein ENN22_08760, partial [bacterium]|nr:hypothetical protein [bacterium]
MKMKTLLVLFIVVAVLSTTAFAKVDKGQLGLLFPAKPGQTSEVLPIDKKELKALQDGQITIRDLRLAKGLGIVDTLKPPYEYSVRFGAVAGDTMAMFFRPPAALIVKSIGMIFSDINDGDGTANTVNLSLAKARYSPDTHPADAVNANGWIGEFKDGAWVVNTELPAEAQNYPIIWDAGGFPLWGDFPITITETHAWIFTDMLFLGFEPDVGRDDFFAIMAPLGDPGVFIRWRSGDATGMPQWYGLKSYLSGGTSGNNGWHVRTYGWEVYAVVDFYENTPPNVSILGSYGTVLSDAARSIFCYVTDMDANDPNQAGADVVTMHYKVNDGDWTDVAATLVEGTDTDGKWE